MSAASPALPPPKVLLVCTSASTLGDEATGAWHEEFAGPYFVFTDGGCDVTIASTAGGAVPVDGASTASLTRNDARFKGDPEASAQLANSVQLSSLDDAALGAFDCVFFAGGHGTVVDFPEGAAAAASSFARAGKVVGAVCHGPMALTQATLADGTSIVAGKRVCGFTDEEEEAVKSMRAGVKAAYDAGIAFSLEAKLRELGCHFAGGAAWSETAVADGKLVTGQNPMSSVKAAKLCLFQLRPVEIVYHNNFTGRAEAPMLLLADAGVEYTMHRDVKAWKATNAAAGGYPCFAAPMLTHGGAQFALAQTTAIMAYLGEALGYTPDGLEARMHVLQAAQNAADVWAEGYNPSARWLDADMQRFEAWVREFDAALGADGDGTYFGGGVEPSYADFAVLNALRTMDFMYAARTKAAVAACARVAAWYQRITTRPNVAKFLATAEPVLYPSKRGD